MPTPTPTVSQIDVVREIAQIPSYSRAETLVNVLKNEQWVRALVVLTEWATIHRKHIKFRGKGVDVDYERYRQQIINEMRVLLGLPELNFDTLIPSGVSRNVARW